MKQQLAKMRGAGFPGGGVAPRDHRLYFQDISVYPRQVATEWRCLHMERWPASGFKALKCTLGSHECSRTSAASTQCPHCPRVTSAMPSCDLCDALVLVLLESLQNLDSALCKNKCVAFHAWLYNCLLYTSDAADD